jgi:hypothetical protein
MAGVQQEEVDADLEISGPDLANAIATMLANDADFIKALCGSPAFISALTSNKQFCTAIAKKAACAAGPALTQGLGR